MDFFLLALFFSFVFKLYLLNSLRLGLPADE